MGDGFMTCYSNANGLLTTNEHTLRIGRDGRQSSSSFFFDSDQSQPVITSLHLKRTLRFCFMYISVLRTLDEATPQSSPS